MAKRKVVAAVRRWRQDDNGSVTVFCDDGSVFDLESSADRVVGGNEYGYYWSELPPIPGTPADRGILPD